MEEYPRTQLEFEQLFATDDACRHYLFSLRWPSGFLCPKCGAAGNWRTKRSLFVCPDCRYQVSVTAGTIFQDSKISLVLWFRAMWHVSAQKGGCSALGLQRVLGIGCYRTAWALLHKLRRAMVRPNRDRLNGIVEVDETFIGGERAGMRGRAAANKVLVLIAAEVDGRKTGRIRLMDITDASAETLDSAIGLMVDKESTVRTDGWKGYNRLTKNGYGHEVVRSGTAVGDNPLPHCHRIASLLKRWILGTHQGATQAEQLPFYLDEFTFRFNRRTSASRGKLFFRLVQQAVQTEPRTLKIITNHYRQCSVESST